MTRPRYVAQPGPPPPQRIVAVEALGRSLALRLEAGRPLLDALHRGFAAAGFSGGVAELAGLDLGPFAYVLPALSETPAHAAFYSRTYRPAGITRLDAGAVTLGMRDGQPFFHCHALWTEADGAVRGGHVLPDETVLAVPATVAAYGLDGAGFATTPDPETGFTLFEPVPRPATGTGRERCFALRLRPNQDLAGALEGFCRDHGLAAATLRGGVGSTIGAGFADGRAVENFATELFVRRGQIGPEAVLDIGLVDFTGAVAEGRLTRGDNPVLMTVELVLAV